MPDPRPDERLWCIVRLDVARNARVNSARYRHIDAARDAARKLQRENRDARFGIMALIETTRPGDDLLQHNLF